MTDTQSLEAILAIVALYVTVMTALLVGVQAVESLASQLAPVTRALRLLSGGIGIKLVVETIEAHGVKLIRAFSFEADGRLTMNMRLGDGLDVLIVACVLYMLFHIGLKLTKLEQSTRRYHQWENSEHK